MAISIDWGTKVISVPQNYLTPLGGSSYSLDTYQFHLDLRDLEDNEAGAPFPPTHNHNTTVTLGGIQYARLIEIINGYTITFEDVGSPYRVFLTGSNNNILDITNLNNVSVAPNNSAGLVQMQEIQHGSFSGGVWVDSINGSPGTVYPKGTPRDPVNNVQDAKTIAEAYGFNTIFINTPITLDTGDNIDGYIIYGKTPIETAITINNGASVSGCDFRDCYITGVLDGNNVLRECIVGNISYVNGFIYKCALNGAITLGGNQQLNIFNCWSATNSESTPPTIDFNGGGQFLSIKNYNGNIRLINKSGPEQSSVGINAGRVFIESTVTNGTIYLRGTGGYVDSSTGSAIVNTDDFISTEKFNAVSGQVWEENASLHVNPNTMGELLNTSGSGGLSPSQADMLLKLYQIMGLDPTKPLVVDDDNNRRYVGPSGSPDIDQDVITTGNKTTVTRTV